VVESSARELNLAAPKQQGSSSLPEILSSESLSVQKVCVARLSRSCDAQLRMYIVNDVE
jgi:hypothetical protein